MERITYTADDLRKQWDNGNRPMVLGELAEMKPLRAAAVAIRIFGELGREASCPAQERFLFAVERDAKAEAE